MTVSPDEAEACGSTEHLQSQRGEAVTAARHDGVHHAKLSSQAVPAGSEEGGDLREAPDDSMKR